ncbi:diacylglycerol/lipid kinase family protein [Sinimarinibacterium flocculans]|uniref:Diacylglycerol kinase family enzyme n=1 Tax=Sinimarinibacterium flocculans TaxID=985250 RepID=A0A318EH32_9GAMM|nr:diacylglycerol kinase family protein [Sinimarinibacterium flocculans]PXV67756.1 diacylglycerol kinase family enzyme [Sinimarinibacterium flocculans]
MTDRAPLFVVINTRSGRTAGDERCRLLASVFREGGREVEFLPVRTPAKLDAVAAQAVTRAAACRGVVVAAGGDGTLSAVAHATLGSDCAFGILPQGTFNYFGREHGVAQDIEGAARSLLRAKPQPVRVGLVNGRAFLVNASLGLYPRLLEDREAYKRQLGRYRWVAIVSGLATLMRDHRQLDLEIENGGHNRHLRTPTLFIGNNRLQFEQSGLSTAADALDAGQLAAIAVEPTRSRALFALALRGAIGQLGSTGRVIEFPFRRLTVHVRGQRRVKVAADGEIHRMRSPLVFSVSPQPLRLMVPAEDDRQERA